jgi:hypothetical protein
MYKVDVCTRQKPPFPDMHYCNPQKILKIGGGFKRKNFRGFHDCEAAELEFAL